ncbi:MAG: glycosyltransferase family 2 protein [Erythrobacter sp.]|jgi:hypothetical protein|nr:glycosyltransferase family 2 protein [Erythrobacter sp.]
MKLITCIGVEHDLALLAHFVEHYRRLGIAHGSMIAILNTCDEASARLSQARQFAEERGLVVEEWIAPYTSEAMWEKRREVQARHCVAEDWVISADVDEFHEYPEDLPRFLARCEAMAVDVVQGPFIDRLAPGGRLAAVNADRPLGDQFPLRAAAMDVVGGAGAHHTRHSTVKVMAMRGCVQPRRGGHDPLPVPGLGWLYGASLGQFALLDAPAFRFAVPTRVNHYHWTDRLIHSLKIRLATPGVSAAGREYGARQLRYLERNDGIALDEVETERISFPRESWPRQLTRMRRRGALMNLAYRARRTLLGEPA